MRTIIASIRRRWGKTAGYLLAAFFAFAAAQKARAVDSLEETGGDVTTTAQLAFKDVALKDVGTMYALRARMQGSWFSDTGVEGTFFNRQETRENCVLVKVTYQLQAIDGGAKAATIEFTEGEGGVYAKRSATTNSGNLNTFGTEPFTANSASGDYVPYDLKLVEPVVRSINVNFTDGNNLDTSSSVRYGGGDYAVPYTAWVNMAAANNGTATIGGATVKITGTRGSHRCVDCSSTKDIRYGYIDESGSYTTPTVTVTGVPYAAYRVVVYTATDNADVKFGYVTINGTDYMGGTDSTVEGDAIWGETGAANKAKGLREGVNYLVSPVLTGTTATIVGHRMSGARGCIAAVQIVEAITGTCTATIDAAGTEDFSALSWDTALPASLAGAKLVVNVEEDATLNIDSAVDASAVEFNVASGKTLTLSGNAITAGAIAVKGAGQVVVGSASQFTGTLRGNGTLVYGAAPSGVTLTDAAWSGVLWLKNCAIAGPDPSTLASVNSTLRLTGVTGYFNTNPGYTVTSQVCAGTLELVDDGVTNAFVVDNGWSDYGITVFEKLKGDGTLGVSTRDISQRYVFKDVSGFTGTINLASRPLRVILGDGASLNPARGTITVVSGATATVALGNTWTANYSGGGIVVNGTLNLADATAALSGAVSGSGTVACADCLPNNAGLAAAGWTGLVTVDGGATTAAGIAAADAASFMNAGSSFTVASGTVVLGTGAGLTGEVNVLAGATLIVMDNSTMALALNGTIAGNVNLTACTALETLTVNLGASRNASVSSPSGLATLNLNLVETFADDGVISIPVSGLSSGVTVNATITDQNGQTKAGTVAVSGATASVTFAPAVSGKACWCAYEMGYVSGSTTGFENTGTDTTPLHDDSGITGDNAFYNGMLYTYAHPWRDITYPSDGNWTAVVRCTVPTYEDAAVITFGTKSAGLIGLVAGADPETQMRLVQTTGDSHYVTNSTMTVQDATTAQHVYIFSVETNQTVKVYCDGEMVLDKTFESRFTLGGGIQVGSVHGGVGNTAIIRFAKNENPAQTLDETVQKNARIDCVRLYKGVLGSNAIRQLSVEFPAVKLFRATVADGATTDWNSLDWSPAWDGGNNVSKIILTVECDATLTLPASITAEDFAINVAEGATLTLLEAAGGTTVAVRNPVEVNTGVVKFGGATASLGYTIAGTGTVALDAGLTVEVPAGGANVRSVALPASGTVTLKLAGDTLADGEYTLLTSKTDIPANFMTHLAVDVPATESEMCLVSTDSRTVKLLVGSPTTAGGLYVWTGKANDGKTDTAGNWFGGMKPPAGADVYIPSVAAAIDNDMEGFAPATITFGDGTGAVTIGGNDMTGVASVANLSAVNHTFNAPVYFSGNIQVKQAADYFNHIAESHVVFAGGAYAAAGYSIETGSTVNWSRCMFGNYYLASTDGSRWTVTDYLNCRTAVADGASLYVPYAGALTELDIGSGAKVDVGDVKFTSANGRLSHNNYGEMVVTNISLTGSGDRFATYNQGLAVQAVFKINSITNSMTDNWFYFADANQASKNVFYIGEGGLNFLNASGSGAYCFGRNSSGNVVTIRPWYSDFTIADKGEGDFGLELMRDVVFCTDDESGTSRTITIDAVTRAANSPRITVSGAGKLQVNMAASNTNPPEVVVTNSATLAFKPGASLGTGATTVNSGATLAVSESGTVTHGGALTLADGAVLGFNFTEKKVAPVLDLTDKTVTLPVNGTVYVNVSSSEGIRPAFYGNGKCTLTSGGKFTGATVSLAAGSPDWAKRVSIDENGDIVLKHIPPGTFILVY